MLVNKLITLKCDVNPYIYKFVKKMSARGQSNKYYVNERNAPGLTVVEKNQFCGKKSEFIASRYLHETYNLPKYQPDLKVRWGHKKLWHIDLGEKYHVKGCDPDTIKNVGDFSWTFQLKNEYNDYGRDPILDVDEGNIILVYIEDYESPEGIVKVECPWHMVKHLLKPPRLAKHFGRKTCLYYEDLKGLFG